MRALLYHEGRIREGGDELLPLLRAAPDTVLWLDFDGEPGDAERTLLIERFGFDRACVEEAHATRHPPTLELLDDHVFMLLRGFSAQAASMDFGIVHLAIFVAPGLLVTRHREVSPSILMVSETARHDLALWQGGAALIALRLGQTVASRHLPIVLGLEERLEAIEEAIFASPDDRLLEELLLYKRQLKKLRRNANYEAQVFQRLSEAEHPLFPALLRREAADAFHRFERLGSLSALYNDLATDLTNAYLSLSSHRLNNVMKVLTVITAIFVPLSFVAGVYGMNFEYMPELHSPNGYYMALGIMAAIAAVSLVVFRLRRWI